MRQAEQERWEHFLVRVRQSVEGTVWEVEALASGATASFPSPQEMVAFIRRNVSPAGESAAQELEVEKL